MIYERLDIVVWGGTLLVFVLLGARAWAVETAGARLYRTATRVRVLTVAAWLSLIALVALLSAQGGVLLVQSVLTRTDPSLTAVVVPANPPPAPPPAAPADPNAPPPAPPADQGAPPADQGGAAPAGPGAGADPNGADPGAP
jgi:hypothetical protein